MKSRRSEYDVTNAVWLDHPLAVCRAVRDLYLALYPAANFSPVADAFVIFAEMFSGRHPEYHGCDTWYHDAQHSLDTTLATARLIDGHERSVAPAERLGPKRAQLGLIIALFHDVGYLRRIDDPATNGAAYTLTHVQRGAEFLQSYLPTVGFAQASGLSGALIHYTGFERSLESIDVSDPTDRRLGHLIATADLLAQMSDRCYLEKCRDFLFHELEFCGMAGAPRDTTPPPAYGSPEHLLLLTPGFHAMVWSDRLDGHFEGSHRYLEAHFAGTNPYVETIDAHMSYLDEVLEREAFEALRRRPSCVQAGELQRIMSSPGNIWGPEPAH